MTGNILFGGAGNTAAKDFGEQDATITSVRVNKSKFTQKARDGSEQPKHDLQVAWKGDDGKTVTCFYGGVYDAGNGDYSFGKNGKARSLIARWIEATGRTPQTINDLVGSRVRVVPKDTEFGGKVSWKLNIVGPAKSAAAPLFPTLNVPAAAAPVTPPAPTVDGAAAYKALDPSIASFLPNALKANGPEQTASALRQGGYAKDDATAQAIVAYVKTLGA